MLEAVRVTLTAYTASFRVPHLVAHQLTLPVPPLSTIYGLISAAAGRWVTPSEVEWLAYRCEYESKATDLEAVLAIERPNQEDVPRFKTRNVTQREFLTFPRLTLYLPPQWDKFFRVPRYALLLGRSQDVASVESIKSVALQQVREGQVSGVLLPLEMIVHDNNSVSAWLHNLPIAFTDEPRRRLLGTHIFGVVDSNQRPTTVQAEGWFVQDTETGVVVPLYRQEWITHVLQRAVSQVR